jgi:hypothetical protein
MTAYVGAAPSPMAAMVPGQARVAGEKRGNDPAGAGSTARRCASRMQPWPGSDPRLRSPDLDSPAQVRPWEGRLPRPTDGPAV